MNDDKPCHNCPDRYVENNTNCHSTCDRYKKLRAMIDKRNAARAAYNQTTGALMDIHYQGRPKRKSQKGSRSWKELE